jgi:voltage-gated potassium channel
MESGKHLLYSIALSIIVIAGGTIGYMLIEGWGIMDALYMTLITISTVGYFEVQPLGFTGRVFTMGLVISGVGFSLYVAAALVQFMVEGRIRIIMGRRRLDRKIGRLKDHFIVCGYGRIGRVLCRNLKRRPVDLVVIEKDADLVPVMEQDGILYISGDAAEEGVLAKARIERAKGLVAVLATDTDNVFLVLTARQLAPDLLIYARAGREGSKQKLLTAGANVVESPYEMGAVSMAHRIIRPTVTSFLNLAFSQTNTEIQMEEIPVGAGCKLQNVELKDSGIRQKYNLIIIAIKKPDGSMMFNPSFETRINSGDTVIAVGEPDNLNLLEKELNC